jgi:hypothetical protein
MAEKGEMGVKGDHNNPPTNSNDNSFIQQELDDNEEDLFVSTVEVRINLSENNKSLSFEYFSN